MGVEIDASIPEQVKAMESPFNDGVPIETVSKMLGHKNLHTTQHYAKVLDRKVSEDMSLLKHKLSIQAISKSS